MNTKRACVIVFLATALAVVGCSGTGSAIEPESVVARAESASQGHCMMGLWQFTADPVEQTLEAVPIRMADMHLNALHFLEPPALLYLTLESLQFNGNIIETDIGLRHPFLGLNEFTGFDVCGLLITNGSVSGFDDASLMMTGDGDTRLLNPDGYSRWWNPSEFPHDNTMLAYKDGLLGTPDSTANFNTTLNAYKLFCDELSASDPVSALDPMSRCVFSAGQQNIRHYTIELGGGLIFNYAVDACWMFPQGDPPYDVPEDFGPGANRPEAWHLAITEIANTLWNDGNDSGGALALSIDVWDHFDAGLNSVKVECPGAFSPVVSSTPVGSGDGYATYEIEIASATPPPDSMPILVSVSCEKENFQGFIPGIYITAYFTSSVTVGTGAPPEGIYVDGDNAGDPDMDGSYTHPFDTIQAGIDLANSGDQVNIDAISGDGIYDEAVSLKSGVKIIGNNWNGGVGKPKVTSSSAGRVLDGYNVSDTYTEGLELILPTGTPFNDFVGWPTVVCIDFRDSNANGGGGSTNGNTVTGCRFTGDVIGSAGCKGVLLEGAVDTLVELCEFVDLNGVGSNNFDIINCVMGYRSDSPTIRQNWAHDLTADASADSGRIVIFNFLWCDYVEITNNLVNSIIGINGYCNIEGFYIDGQPGDAHSYDPVIVNNTIDDFTNPGNYGFLIGILFSNTIVGTYAIPNVELYNNIVSNSSSNSASSRAYEFTQVNPSDPCTAYFCNAYNTAWMHQNGAEGFLYVVMGTGCFGNWTSPQNPGYINPPTDYDLPSGSTSQRGDPGIVDWDDTGAPSGNPSNNDINTRSRMGAFGGPNGNWWPLG